VRTAIILAGLLAPSLALAQDASPNEPAPPSVRADAAGFSLQSSDGAFQLRLRGYAQAGARFYLADEEELGNDAMLLRRVRPSLQAKLHDDFEVRIQLELASRIELLDAYVAWRPVDAFGLRAGKMKTPVSFERLQSPTGTVFLERAFPSSVAPNRDLGLLAFGEVAGGVVSYEAGVFNGTPDGANSESNPSDSFDLVARMWLEPGASSGIAALAGLGFGGAVTWGDQRGTAEATDLSGYRTAGGRRFFRFASDGTAEGSTLADGTRTRVAGALAYLFGGFGLLGEYVHAAHEVSRGAEQGMVSVDTWAATARYVLGGDASWEAVSPRSAVGAGGMGALELKARVEQLSIAEAIDTFAGASNAESATSVSGGLTWWLNRSARVLVDYHNSTFSGPADADAIAPEHALLTSVQLGF
jgi:phosphate-selective porin OprO/OprP